MSSLERSIDIPTSAPLGKFRDGHRATNDIAVARQICVFAIKMSPRFNLNSCGIEFRDELDPSATEASAFGYTLKSDEVVPFAFIAIVLALVGLYLS